MVVKVEMGSNIGGRKLKFGAREETTNLTLEGHHHGNEHRNLQNLNEGSGSSNKINGIDTGYPTAELSEEEIAVELLIFFVCLFGGRLDNPSP
ncbi:hypothetical protein FRX31_016192 [Thalictrum thalictroides]|uniref:Uncharacterized protein n=1 Tax=Thalictrum thalictroides TaxID=46969 RepID=A0A7J6WBG0_THATH|nr:hypothetical protein FRX31_016192 [Thalictrum thalictroides]